MVMLPRTPFVREQIVALEHHADTRAQFTGPVDLSGSFRARLAGIDHLIVMEIVPP